MEYAIFILTFIFILWAHHRIKYSKSNYGKFEYYLNGEANNLKSLIILFEIFMLIGLIILCVYLGGLLTKHFLSILNFK